MTRLDAWQMPLEGTSMIEASAGTGKTYTLTTLYLRMLVEYDLRPADLLVVTFTEAATAELRDRVRARIREAIVAAESGAEAGEGEEEQRSRALVRDAEARAARRGGPDALRRALQDFDEAAIFTIHGFCRRTLQEHAFESGLAFDAELVEESAAIQRALAHDLYRRLIEAERPDFVEWLIHGSGRRWQFSPEQIQKDLLDILGAEEDMPLIPARPPDDCDEGIPDAIARLSEALTDWAAFWRAEGEPFAEALLEKGRWHGRKLGPANLTRHWLPALERFAVEIEAAREATDRAALALPGCFDRFASAKLAEASKAADALRPLESRAGRRFDAVIEAARALRVARDTRALWLRHRVVEEVRRATRARCDTQHRLFFDDLLRELRRALRGAGGPRLAALLRERYRFALIDEFQDTDPVQYEIFRRVWHERGSDAPGGGLVLIGDPKQAIYSFRNADVFTYLSARGDAADRVYALDTNWRSDPPLIDAVNALFGSSPRPFLVDEIGFEPVGPRPGFAPEFSAGDQPDVGLRVFYKTRAEQAGAVQEGEAQAEDTSEGGATQDVTKTMNLSEGRRDVYQAMANALVDLLQGGARIGDRPLQPSDVAVLCRRKFELALAREALEAVGVPCVDRGDADVFDQREAWELLCVMKAWLRPGDPAILRAALATSAQGGTASSIAALADDAPALAAASERFAEYGRLWSRFGFARAFETWRREEGVTPRLLHLVDGDRRLTNHLHLAELLRERADERARSRAGLIALLERAIANPDERAAFGREASLLRLERDDAAVELVTLHRSKGLEYPIVLLPGLWETAGNPGIGHEAAGNPDKRHPPVRFHDPRTDRRTIDLAGHPGYAEHVARAERENFSEQLRLLYVGLTRARHQCWIGWGAFNPTPKTPMAWLLHTLATSSIRARPTQGEGVGVSDLRAVAAAVAAWTDSEWLQAWSALAARAGDRAVSAEIVGSGSRTKNRPPGRAARRLVEPEAPRSLGQPLRTTSFSALVREGSPGLGPPTAPELIGRDIDEGIDPSGGGAARSAGDAATGQDDLTGASRPATLAGDMDRFPRGTEAGTLLHDVLERADLAGWAAGDAGARAASAAEAERCLERSGLGVAWRDAVLHVVDAVARTPLGTGEGALRLGDLGARRIRRELEFTLSTPPPVAGPGFTPDTLADALARAPADSPSARYAERARRLDFRALDGFLRGFIDAVVFDGDRYFVVDYKSNHLGADPADYRAEALVAPIVEHDYVLQYLLYTVAVDRHLATRRRDYAYDRHFGGVYYLFLRGLAPTHPPGCGVFFDRPPRALVETLAGWLGVPGRLRAESGR